MAEESSAVASTGGKVIRAAIPRQTQRHGQSRHGQSSYGQAAKTAMSLTGDRRAHDHPWMRLAIELSRMCPPAGGAYSVGAILVAEDGTEMSRGYSRETDATIHAEESALAKVPADDHRLATATLYSTLEPCSQRASRPHTCTQLILAAGISRVVVAWREPALFVADCQGIELLEHKGVTVVEMREFSEEARAVNTHLAIDQ